MITIGISYVHRFLLVEQFWRIDRILSRDLIHLEPMFYLHRHYNPLKIQMEVCHKYYNIRPLNYNFTVIGLPHSYLLWSFSCGNKSAGTLAQNRLSFVQYWKCSLLIEVVGFLSIVFQSWEQTIINEKITNLKGNLQAV